MGAKPDLILRGALNITLDLNNQGAAEIAASRSTERGEIRRKYENN
jgi:hypothetical protein